MQDITDVLEAVARQGHADHGRGWVLVRAGQPPVITYVPLAAWPEFLREWQVDDHGDMDLLLNGYEPITEYIMLVVETDHVTPVQMRYRTAAPPMA